MDSNNVYKFFGIIVIRIIGYVNKMPIIITLSLMLSKTWSHWKGSKRLSWVEERNN